MKLYIVRHAQSKRNAKLEHSKVDTDLTDIGHEQAKRLGVYFKKIKLKKIYCSKLIRARKTLKEILPYVGKVNVEYTKEVVEHSIGIYGMNGKDDWESYVKDMEKSGLSLIEFRPKNGESLMDAYIRAGKFYQKLLKKHKNDKILVVAHNAFNKYLIMNALKLNIEEGKYFNLSNASVSIIGIDKNGKVKKYDIDDFHHIIDYALKRK